MPDLGSKLLAWHDHSDLSTLLDDFLHPISASDYTEVAYVTDKSGNNRIKENGGSESPVRPVFVSNGGKPGLLYDGSDDYMEISAPAFPISDIDYFVVTSNVSGVNKGIGSFAPSSGLDYNNASACVLLLDGSQNLNLSGGSSGSLSISLSGTASSLGSTICQSDVSIKSGVATLTTTANGGTSGTDSSFTLSATHSGKFLEGCRFEGSVTNYLSGIIHETIFAYGLSSGERQAVRSYLAAKWLS